MNVLLKRVLLGLGIGLAVTVVGVGGYAWAEAREFDESMDRVRDAALPTVNRSTEARVLARGKHIAESLGGCAASACHGADFAGGQPLPLGPLGTIVGPNITAGGMLSVYTDAELARLVRTGIKKDGRSVRMMPVPDFYWLPDSDVSALVSYLRTVPASEKTNASTHVGLLGKVLDRQGKFAWDIARIVEGLPRASPPAPEPTAAYGQYVVRLCTGCHGETLSGGPVPGAPPSLPVPLNITTHETGIKDYTFDDFVRVLQTGQRKNGKQLDPFMATELTRNLDDVELKALWAAIQSRPAKAFGGR
jgi:mono/diheme cytochrome c family protein